MIEAFIRYLQTERGLSALTLKAYASDLDEWQRFMRHDHPDGDFCPERYTASDLRLWLAHLGHSGMKASTVRRKASALKAFYRRLLSLGLVAVNPAEDLASPRAAKPLPAIVRPEESAAMLDGQIDESDFEQVRDRLIMLMLYTTGMRSSELTGLLDCNVDTRSGELKVHGKRNKDRLIPMGEELMKEIDRYRALRRATVGTEAPELFVLASGRPLYRKALYNIVHRLMAEADVHAGRLSPHVMRHTFATDLLNGGARLDAVSRLMGHSSLRSTQIYTHISHKQLRDNYLTAHPRAQKKGQRHGS